MTQHAADTEAEAESLPDRTCRRIARIAWALLIPTALLAWFLVLFSPAFTDCLMGKEDACTPGARPTAWWTFWVSAVAGAVAAYLPLHQKRRRRQLLLGVQLTGHVLMTSAILAQA